MPMWNRSEVMKRLPSCEGERTVAAAVRTRKCGYPHTCCEKRANSFGSGRRAVTVAPGGSTGKRSEVGRERARSDESRGKTADSRDSVGVRGGCRGRARGGSVDG